MTTTLITGASKGLGLQTARRLTREGHTVYLGARDARRGARAARAVGARPLLLDVADDGCVAAAAEQVRERTGRLDVLVDNAGVAGLVRAAGEVTAADMLAVYDTNVLGAVRVTQAFLPLLLRSVSPVVVNVSSGLGWLAVAADPSAHASLVPFWISSLPCNSSEAALNMVTVLYARALPRMRINAVDPGHTATDLNAHTGARSVEQGADIIVRMALIGPDGPTGGYYTADGPMPW
ncbi:SDR family NAD(P)-dependent oxidoreductase [Streptomyces olindensis]|uniref:SDR family NAD(P)-dependent oxidoreductase n=1 Tax=Streptomyces olindensis TaxID=358823 RepID=UPI0033E8F5F4